jgi:hypothetical protein
VRTIRPRFVAADLTATKHVRAASDRRATVRKVLA